MCQVNSELFSVIQTTKNFVSDKYIKLDRDCRKEELGLTYMGTHSRTRFNNICQRWTEHVPQDHGRRSAQMYPDKNIPAAENYCRNIEPPDATFTDPVWCFTMNSSIRYEPCDIPMCGKVLFFLIFIAGI